MEEYGSDFITISDEDGQEYELEVLMEMEYQGKNYLAVVPATDDDDQEQEVEVSILRSDVEDGEPILSAILDEEELRVVFDLMMERLYEDEDEEDQEEDDDQ